MTPPEQNQDSGLSALNDALTVSFRLLRFVLLLLLVVYLFSGFFEVAQHERAFVLTFGQAPSGPDRVLKPGFKITWPKPFSEVVKVETERVKPLESTTFALRREQPLETLEDLVAAGTPDDPFGYTLTGDVNVMHSGWALQYQISDPEAFAFKFADLEQILLAELDHAVVKTSAGMPIDEALLTDVEKFRAGVEAELRARTQAAGLGIQVERVDILSTAPPLDVRSAFYEVIEEGNARSAAISAARGEAASTVNRAKGNAARAQAQAEAYRKRIVDEVSADADYFKKILAEYVNSPVVLPRTLLQDTLRRVLLNVGDKYVVRDGKDGQEFRLILSPKKKMPWDAAAAQDDQDAN